MFLIKRKSVQRTCSDTQIVHQLQTRGVILCLGTFLPGYSFCQGTTSGRLSQVYLSRVRKYNRRTAEKDEVNGELKKCGDREGEDEEP